MGQREQAAEVFANGGTQEHLRIEYFLGIVINQDTGEARRRNTVGQRGRNKTAGADADKDIRLMGFESINRLSQRGTGPDLVNGAERTSARQRDSYSGQLVFPQGGGCPVMAGHLMVGRPNQPGPFRPAFSVRKQLLPQ